MGDFSTVTCKKLNHLLDVFCKDTDIRIIFSSFKIKNFFSFKDPIPDALKSLVVYQFTCAGCNSHYIGETSRHFIGVKEHPSNDKNSHVYKHLNGSPSCKSKCSGDCFKILFMQTIPNFHNSNLSIYIFHSMYIAIYFCYFKRAVAY